jgi:hypothetical protein
VKEFTTAAKAAVSDDDDAVVEFTVDGLEVKAYQPSSGQMAMVYQALSDYNSDQRKVAGIIDFFFGLLDENVQQVLGKRLLSREDPFDLDQVTEILSWLVEEWAGRPTQSSSGSTRSPTPIGPKSTATSRNGGSTRSRSPSTASAT